MSLSRSKKLQLFISFAISIGLIAWLLSFIEFSKVTEQLKVINYWMLIPVVALSLLHMVFRAMRWRYLLPSTFPTPFMARFDGIMLGGLATFILPFRAGEIVRPVLLSQKTEVGFMTAFVSVIIERIFDLIAVLVSFGALLALIPQMPSEVFKGASALLVLGFAMLVGLFVAAFAPGCMRLMVVTPVKKFLPKLLPFVEKFMEDILQGAGVLRDPKALLSVLLLTVVVWGSNFAIYYLCLMMANIEPQVLLSVAIAVILALAVAAPSAPGFIGPFQVGCVIAFSLFGYSRELGVAFSIMTHLFQYLFLITYGTFALMLGSYKISDLLGAKKAT